MADHGDDKDGPLFRPVRNNRASVLERPFNVETLSENADRKPLER